MNVYHAHHDWDGELPLACTIVEAIAAVCETEPDEMDPLYSAVDPDALEQLFESLRQSVHRNGEERTEFTFDGYRIAVSSNGDVRVRAASEATAHEGPVDEDTFQSGLARLVRTAETNGVDVEGGWACRSQSDSPDWGIEIYEVD